MDSWFIKQPRSQEHVSDTGASTSVEELWLSCCKVGKGDRISYFLVIFTYKSLIGEEHSQCVLCGEILANDSLNARSEQALKTGCASFANKPLEFFEQKLMKCADS
jgi:hypothetical protein